MLWYIDYFNIKKSTYKKSQIKQNENKIKVHGKVELAYRLHACFCSKDFNHTHGYMVEEDNC